MDNDRDNISVRVASFSSYLDTACCKDTFARGVSPQENNPIILNPEKTASHTTKNFRVDSFSYSPIEDPSKAFTFSQGNPKNDKGEISVFGADKYFSMKLEYPNSQRHERRPIDLIGVESKIKPRTPSLCSEASSSFNSQSALIPNSTAIRRIESQTKAKKTVRRRLFAGLGCHQVPCFDKKDVQSKDIVFIPTENTVRKNPGFSYVEESRTSIEVFGSSKEAIKRNKGSSEVAASMERKLSMLTWDAIVEKKAQTFQTSTTTANSTVIFDDVAASDASSDLFEIENISGTLYPMLTPSSSSAAIGAANVGSTAYCMSPAYAPSEDSIQWSVVTASAADYSSVLSEFNDGDVVNGGNGGRKFRPRNVIGEKEVVQKGKASGGILGCKNQKAVDVAENLSFEKDRAAKDKEILQQLPRSYAKLH